jgi:hypothetical protein
MFAFVRFLLLAVIVLAVVLFIQPNLLKELGLQLPDEETSATSGPGSIDQKDEEPGATEPMEGAITEPPPASEAQLSADSPATGPEPVAGTGPDATQQAPAEIPEPVPAIEEEAETPAVALPADEPVTIADEPVTPVVNGDTPQDIPAIAEPASEESISESLTGSSEEMASEPPPSESADEVQPAPPAVSDEELPLLPEMPPPYAEGTELPVVPVPAEEPALQPEIPEKTGGDMDQAPESPVQESGSEQSPADDTAPAEPEEIPTAGSPELQRVLENIDRTFNN